MVRGISAINGLAKKGLMGVVLAGSMFMGATAPMSAKNTQKPTQTELVSREGAEAMRAASGVEAPTQEVPTVHNPKLDATLRKFIETDDDRTTLEGIIKSSYEQYGTYCASAIIQHLIDYANMSAFLNGKTYVLTKNGVNTKLGEEIESFGSDFYKNIINKADSITGWMDNSYTPNIFSALSFNSKPNAKEVIDKLDYIAQNKIPFAKEDLTEYIMLSANFTEKKTSTKNNTQALSDIIAYKMFLIDKFMFTKILENSDIIYSRERFESNHKSIGNYFDMWMNSVSPRDVK